MISQLGNDAFGDIIVETIEQLGVGTQYIKRTNKANTALAFVSLQDDGQRDFSFYRKPSADMLYQPENIDDIQIFQDDILNFCSVDLIESDMKNDHEKMIEKFESVGGTIVFDPNVRLPLWEDKLECQRTKKAYIPKAHIKKKYKEKIIIINLKKN